MIAKLPQLSAVETPKPRRLRAQPSEVFGHAASGYQMTLVASSVKDVVSSVGGWLFDRTMGGWVVNSLQIADLKSDPDLLPLRILGYRMVRREVGDLPPAKQRSPIQTFAIAGDVALNDARVRAMVKLAANRGTAEVVMWGSAPEDLQADSLTSVRYRLSSAARAFKTEAMRAADLPTNATQDQETFYCTATSTLTKRMR
jgi:hypothetical protein